jgi:hypothetical protein
MPTIEISDETFEKIKDQLLTEEKNDINSYEDYVGKMLFFRTVTYHILGRVVKIMGNIFQLEDAAWIADSGRFMNFIKHAEVNEVEPLGDWNININSVTDFGVWKHKPLTKQI